MRKIACVLRDDRGIGLISVEGFTLIGVILAIVLATGQILTSTDTGIPNAATTLCGKVNESILNPTNFGQ